jgi:hypothetical protein
MPTSPDIVGNWGQTILAIGALGTAAFGLVDTSKALGGGVSRCGFGKIEGVLTDFLGSSAKENTDRPLTRKSIRDTLFASYINGVAMADQREIAKSLLKMRLNDDSAAVFAAVTKVDPDILRQVAAKINHGLQSTAAGAPGDPQSFTPLESNVFGRFDLMLTMTLEEAYQHADQIYRNSSKLLALVVAVALSLAGGYGLSGMGMGYFESVNCAYALLAGLLATPLAPIAKDLASSLQAAAKAVQSFSK